MINKKIDTIIFKKSPFEKIKEFKKTKGKRKIVGTDITPEDYELIEKYFKMRDPDYAPNNKKNNKINSSKFVKELLMKFFNSIALEKKSIENLYFVLLLPKTQEVDEINFKGEIVGAFQSDTASHCANFFKFNRGTKNEFNFMFDLEEFNEQNYNDFISIFNGKEFLFFSVGKSVQYDFLKVKAHFKEIGLDIDLDDCYFTIINVNNYLDRLYQGQYVQGGSYNSHHGLIALIDKFDKNRICLTCKWCYTTNFFEVEFYAHDVDVFNEYIIHKTDNDELVDEYYSIVPPMTLEEFYEDKIKELDKHIEDLKRLRDNNQALLDEIYEKK